LLDFTFVAGNGYARASPDSRAGIRAPVPEEASTWRILMIEATLSLLSRQRAHTANIGEPSRGG